MAGENGIPTRDTLERWRKTAQDLRNLPPVSEQIAEWAELIEQKAKLQSAQLDQNESRGEMLEAPLQSQDLVFDAMPMAYGLRDHREQSPKMLETPPARRGKAVCELSMERINAKGKG